MSIIGIDPRPLILAIVQPLTTAINKSATKVVVLAVVFVFITSSFENMQVVETLIGVAPARGGDEAQLAGLEEVSYSYGNSFGTHGNRISFCPRRSSAMSEVSSWEDAPAFEAGSSKKTPRYLGYGKFSRKTSY